MICESIFKTHWLRSVTAAAAVLFTAILLTAAPTETGKKAVIQVKGLSCPICVHRLEQVLTKLPGATKAEVSLEKGQAVIEFHSGAHAGDQQITQTIRDAGFVPGNIEWHEPESPNSKAQ